MDVAIGTRIGKYTVEALLGRGGMASVFRVRHDELGTHYALKLLDLPSPVVRERLVSEGRMQAALRHPNIVSVFDVVVHDGCPGLVMEYVDGPSLHVLIHAEPIIPAPVRDALVSGIVYGVRAAHRVGLVHRDLKPGNILLARTDEALVPKVADFGLAKVVSDDDSPSRRTRTGAFLGTPVYMAPEQVRNAKDVDARADVFALGVICYELATKRLPVDSEDLIELFSRIVKREYPRPREICPDLPQHQEDAILGALEPEPTKRIPDCDVLLAVWRGRIRFEPDSTPMLERTSPFDLAFLRRAAQLGAGDSAIHAQPQPPAEPPPAPQAPGPAALIPTVPPPPADSVPTERLQTPDWVPSARPTVPGTGRAALVLGGASFAAAMFGAALVVVSALAAVVWVWRSGDAPAVEPVERDPVAVVPAAPGTLVPAPPDPSPGLEIVPVTPVPDPVPQRPSPGPRPRPAPPPPTGTVSFEIDGRVSDLWLVGEDQRKRRAGRVPPGIYHVRATFPDHGEILTPTSIVVGPGETIVVRCVEGFANCTRK